MIHIEIIEVLQEYRNGNKDILNTLYSDKVKYKNNSGFKFYDRSQFVILDQIKRTIFLNSRVLMKKQENTQSQSIVAMKMILQKKPLWF